MVKLRGGINMEKVKQIKKQESNEVVLTEELYRKLSENLNDAIGDLLEVGELIEKDIDEKTEELNSKNKDIKIIKKRKKEKRKIYKINFSILRELKSKLCKIDNEMTREGEASFTLIHSNLFKNTKNITSFNRSLYTEKQKEKNERIIGLKAQKEEAHKAVNKQIEDLNAIQKTIDEIVDELKAQKNSRKQIIKTLKDLKKELFDNYRIIQENEARLRCLRTQYRTVGETFIVEDKFKSVKSITK